MVLVKNLNILDAFHDIVKRKNAFLDYKKKEVKKSKNWDFSKGDSPWI